MATGDAGAAATIALARREHAALIAAMSRDYVEAGLGWSWGADRVRQAIVDRSTNVAVIAHSEGLAAFGIMHYGDDTAHLALLAVHPDQRRRGLATRLLWWLEQPARTAGIDSIRLEARADNPAAIAFYQRCGYVSQGALPGYYRGQLDALRLEKRLHD